MREIWNRRTPECSSVARLTRREVEILRLVAEGNSNPDVARLLWITDHTVKFHLANIYRKLGIRNRIEASEWASQNGLFRPDEKHPLESGEQIDNFNIPSDNEEAAA